MLILGSTAINEDRLSAEYQLTSVLQLPIKSCTCMAGSGWLRQL